MQQPVYADNTTITGDGTEAHPLVAVGSGGGNPGGNPNDVQFNDAGAFGGTDDFQFFPEGSAGGEFIIFVSSDGNNCELFIGTDNSSTQTTGTFIAQVDGGDIAIIMNNEADMPLGILLENTHAGGAGIKILDTSLGGILLEADGANTIALEGDGVSATAINLGNVALTDNPSLRGVNISLDAKNGIFLQTEQGGAAILLAGQGAPTEIRLGRAPDSVGFFNVTPVGQQPTPILLSDVIALLQAFGLSA